MVPWRDPVSIPGHNAMLGSFAFHTNALYTDVSFFLDSETYIVIKLPSVCYMFQTK